MWPSPFGPNCESRRDGDAAAPQEVLRQLERGQPQPPHVGEREVAALRRVAADPRDPVEPVDEVVALALQVGDVVAEPGLHVAGEHGMGRALPDRRAGLEGEAEDAVHVIDDLGGPDRVADPVRGHAVRLREGEGRHGPLLHAGQGGDAVVRRPVQQRLLVLLVREHPEIEPPGQVGDLLEFLAAEDDARGVPAVAHHEELALAGGPARQRLEVEAPLALLEGERHRDDPAAGHADRRLGARVLRIEQQHLVTGADQDPERAVDDLLGADRRSGPRRRGPRPSRSRARASARSPAGDPGGP